MKNVARYLSVFIAILILITGCNFSTIESNQSQPSTPESPPDAFAPTPSYTPPVDIYIAPTATPGEQMASANQSEHRLAGLVYTQLNSPLLIQIGLGGEHRPLYPLNSQISPDGRTALYILDGEIMSFDLLDHSILNLTQTPDRIENSPQWWLGQSGTLVFGSYANAEELSGSFGYLTLFDPQGSFYRVIEDQPSLSKPALSPTSSLIAYELSGVPWLYDINTDSKMPFDLGSFGLADNLNASLGHPTWSPDGNYLAWWLSGELPGIGQLGTAVIIFDLQNKTTNLIHPYQNNGINLAYLQTPLWNPDSRWLVFNTIGEINRSDLWVASRDGTEEFNLGRSAEPTWSPDGQYLAYLDMIGPGVDYTESVVRMVERDIWQPEMIDLPPLSNVSGWTSVLQEPSMMHDPVFIGPVYFASQPAFSSAQSVFPGGTKQVFALISYSDMRPGLTIRRELYLDGELSQQSEETWNYAKYGQSGVMRDISANDFENGLAPGDYEVRLFIDNQPSAISETPNRFRIEPPLLSETGLSSPDGTKMAFVEAPGKLIIQDASGARNELIEVEEISSIAWFPDSRHLAISNRDRTFQQRGDTRMVSDSLIFVDSLSGEQQHLDRSWGSNLHDPLISPDGRYIALIEGGGWSDACYVDSRLVVLRLDENLQANYAYGLVPENLLSPENVYLESLVEWVSPDQLVVELDWTCTVPNPKGRYLIDITTGTTAKLDE